MKGYLVTQLYVGSFDGGSVMVSMVALKLQAEVPSNYTTYMGTAQNTI